jgi:hypothetical protein
MQLVPETETLNEAPTTSMLSSLPDIEPSLTTGPLGFSILLEFDYQKIHGELTLLQNSVNAGISGGPPSDQAFLDTISSIYSNKLEADRIPSTWAELSKIDANIEIRPADARILTALSLQSHSDMWTWFDVHVTEPTRRLAGAPVGTLEDMGSPEMPNEWIFPLFQSVRFSLIVSRDVRLKAKDFFPNLEAPNYEAPPGSRPMPSRVLGHVEAAIILWLQFRPRPGMALATSRAVATFTSVALGAFDSPDFLYLSSIQNGIKRLRSILTEENVELTKVPWEKLAEELEGHPLASPGSNETLALNYLKELLWAISSFPHPHRAEKSGDYQRAVAVGGPEGIEVFAQHIVSPPPM